MKIPLPDYVYEIMQLLIKNNYECYLVGGAIRNYLLNYKIKDYDLTTNATPQEMIKVFHDYPKIPTGIKHGTLTILSHLQPIEITTYRIDGEYNDHRHPKQVQFSSSLKEDCARRDFSINALCYHPDQGLIDFFHGRDDLNKHLIRCIGNAEERFDEDALRILRALRFAARLNFKIEAKTTKAMFKKRNLLSYISKERIHAELIQFFSYENSASFLELYFEIFISAIPALSTINQHFVFHNMKKKPLSTISRLAILFSTLPNYHYVLKEMTFSNEEIKKIENIIQYQTLSLNSSYDAYHLLSIFKEFKDYIQYRVAIDPSLDYAHLMSWLHKLKNDAIPTSLSELKFNGYDAQKVGYKGISIKNILNELLELCMKEKLSNEYSDLRSYAKRKLNS